ncbi:MAG TPA: alpha/beta hydrolase [Blastocatellia bacterium]|nr:alpha/beta hydrolase [Blastocatellia bacterium]
MIERKINHIPTSFGEIAYTSQGSGPAALFVHGAFQNGYSWRQVIDRVADIRRCIAIDLMAHGATQISAAQDVSLEAQAGMLDAVAQALDLHQIDLVGHDSGGAIAQIFAARHPERIATLTLGNCDVHENCPPEALKPLMDAIAAGQLAGLGQKMLADAEFARSSFAVGYERPDQLSDETLKLYLEPLFSTPEAAANLERFFRSIDRRHTVAVEPLLRQLDAPTLVVWGAADVFFDIKWAYWLRDTIPGCRKVIELEGAKLFFPEERPEVFAAALREHWLRENPGRL